MLKKLLTCMACAAVTAFAVENVKELEKDRLFDADFAAMWQAQTADAQFATGSPKGIILQGTRLTFDADPTEAICQGIIVGEDCAAVRYQTEGNFAPESGTFEVVFANNAWVRYNIRPALHGGYPLERRNSCSRLRIAR